MYIYIFTHIYIHIYRKSVCACDCVPYLLQPTPHKLSAESFFVYSRLLRGVGVNPAAKKKQSRGDYRREKMQPSDLAEGVLLPGALLHVFDNRSRVCG